MVLTREAARVGTKALVVSICFAAMSSALLDPASTFECSEPTSAHKRRSALVAVVSALRAVVSRFVARSSLIGSSGSSAAIDAD